MIGRRGSLRSSGDRNCKRFLPYLPLQRSILSVAAAVHSSLMPPLHYAPVYSLRTCDLPGMEYLVLFNALPIAKNEHC
jgi:hypothetical protein